jgi:hypothetical protein
MALDFYLGPPGAPILLPPNIAPVEFPIDKPTAVQELLSGGLVVDRFGRGRRRYSIPYAALTADELSIIEYLALQPSFLILDDPNRRNRLTSNQSTGGDALRTDEGVIARFQGTEAVSTAQFRSGSRSFAWFTTTALAATGRGLYLYSNATTPDDTWHPVRVGAIYSGSGYLRTSAAVSMQAIIDWMGPTGAYLSTDLGTGTAVSTSGFTRVSIANKPGPAGAAYGILGFLNTTTTGAAITVWLDDPQMEEGATVTAQVVGTGVPRVAVVETPMSSPLLGYNSPALTLQEV